MAITQRLNRGITLPFRTAASIAKGAPVKLDSSDSDYVVTSTSSNDGAIIGVTADKSAAGGTVDVVVFGIAPVKVQTSASVAVGDYLMNGTEAGEAVEIGTSGGTNYHAFAKVLVAPGADNDLVTCLVNACHRAQG